MRRQIRFFLLLLCLVVLCEAAGSQQQPPTVTLRPRSIASTPGTPAARVHVDQRRVPLGTSVSFTVAPAGIVKDYVVTLYFGDGHKRVLSEPQITYVYPAVGNYTYAVDVKPRPRCEPRVTLSTSANSVSEAESVKFAAQLSGNCLNIQYRFVFGDGSSSNWQSNAEAQHSYARAGKYLAYVDISNGKSRIGGSTRKRLDVTHRDDARKGKVTVALTAEPLAAQSGKPVTFTANVSPLQADTRYLFNFGDGRKTLWQAVPQSTHTYETRGVYRAYVQVSQFLNNQSVSATSAPAVLRVRPAPGPTPDAGPSPTPATRPTPGPGSSPTAGDSPTPSPGDGSPSPGLSAVTGSETPAPTASNFQGSDSASNKWWYLLIAAVILFLIYQASGVLFAARPAFAPFSDPGVAAVAHEKGMLPIDFQLVLDPNVSGGDYSVTTDQPRLVTNAPEPEERHTFEI